MFRMCHKHNHCLPHEIFELEHLEAWGYIHVYLPKHNVCMLRGRLSTLASGLISIRGYRMSTAVYTYRLSSNWWVTLVRRSQTVVRWGRVHAQSTLTTLPPLHESLLLCWLFTHTCWTRQCAFCLMHRLLMTVFSHFIA